VRRDVSFRNPESAGVPFDHGAATGAEAAEGTAGELACDDGEAKREEADESCSDTHGQIGQHAQVLIWS
jgi:hypothetical protein